MKRKWKIKPIDFIGSSVINAIAVVAIAFFLFICCMNVYNRNKKIDAAIEQIKEANKTQHKTQRMYKNQTFLGLLKCLCIINQEGQKGWKNLEELEAAVYFYNHLIGEGYDLKDIKIESLYIQKDTKSGKLKLKLPMNK